MIIIDPNNNSDIIKSLKPHALRDQLKLQYSWSVTLLTLPLPACRAGSIKRYRCASVRPSVCLSVPAWTHSSQPAYQLLQVCCCGLDGQEISVDCCSMAAGECGQWHVVSVRRRLNIQTCLLKG